MSALTLTHAHFKAYPEAARALVAAYIETLKQLPPPFASLLLREVISYDWKFPMERREIDSDLHYLATLEAGALAGVMKPFRELRLPVELLNSDWVTDPVGFSEKLSAHLWASHQIDTFRSAAVAYMDRRTAALPPKPRPIRRMGIVLVGDGVGQSTTPLFRKLRPHGTLFTNIEAKDGTATILNALARRAALHPEPFAHWYIDGGQPLAIAEHVTSVSYGKLSSARAILQRELKSAYETHIGSEMMRTQLARKKPEDLGLKSQGDDAVLSNFAVSTLTEGSGTQIYSTSFVQWAAREAMRRAQPLTLLTRFRPRQRERPMQELLLESQRAPDLDPAGSLVDADMGAYYCWLNQQRLPGAADSSFLVWFENHGLACVVGQQMDKASTDTSPIELKELLGRLA